MNKTRSGLFCVLIAIACFASMKTEASIQFFNRLLGRILIITVSPVYSTNGANWNDWVSRTNNTASDNDNNQPDNACSGSESGKIEGCIHGGEKKKAALTGIADCTGITASDELNAFDWECIVVTGSPNTATIFSKKLKPTARLADLLNPTSWKNNRLNVYRSGALIAQSASTSWWTNPVQAPPANTTTGDDVVLLASAGTVYHVSSNTQTSGYNINANKIAFVVKPGVTLSYNGRSTRNFEPWFPGNGEVGSRTQYSVLSGGSQDFTWVEGRFDGTGYPTDPAGYVLGFVQMRLLVMRFVNIVGGGGASTGAKGGMVLVNITRSLFSDITIEQTGGNWDGIYEYDGNNNRWLNVFINARGSTGNPTGGANFSGNSNFRYNIAVVGVNGTPGAPSYGARAITNNYGYNSTMVRAWASGANDTNFNYYMSYNNTLHMATSANAGQTGIVIQDSYRNTINHFVAVNGGNATNGGSGIFFQNGDSNRLSQIVIAHQAAAFNNAIASDANSTANDFRNYVLLGNNTNNCSAGNGTSGFTSACANQGASSATWRTGISLANSFVGKVTSDDSANPSDSNGSRAFGSITNWYSFDNFFRGWGQDGSAFPNADNRGSCDSGTCRIWDWRVKSADTVIRYTSNDGLNQNDGFASGTPCPAAVGGSYSIQDQQTSPNTFLVNAMEVIGDYSNGKMIGDDDGLCESGETCIYGPNYGAYQGEGDYTTGGTCNFSSGTVTGVIMYNYPANGG